MKLFWQKAEVQKFEHAKDFAEEYNIGKKDFILASKSTYEAYFAALGLEAHVEYKSKYGKGEPTDEMIDALLADFRKTDCDRIIAIGGGAVIDMAKILVLAGDYSAEEIFHILNDCNARVWKSQRIGGILLRDKIFRKMTGRIRKNEAFLAEGRSTEI